MANCISLTRPHLISSHFHVLYLIILAQTASQIVPTPRLNPSDTYLTLYESAVEAYLEEKWHECVNLMSKAVDDYKLYWNSIIFCRINCRDKNKQRVDKNTLGNEDLVLDDDNDLNFYLETVKMSLCLMKCKKSRLGIKGVVEFIPKIEQAFENRVPYDYLQLCQFKMGNVRGALNSAYTYLAWNPNYEAMKYNFKYYTTLPDVQLQNIKNLETRTFQELYLMGNDAYNKQEYHEVKHYFESALEEYLISEEECRAKCEGPFDNNANLDFTTATANYFTFALKCKQKCEKKLSFLYGEQIEDFYASHFHYLQFAYYKVHEIKNACQAVASYLLFHPKDETMMANKKFYLSLDGVNEEDFQAPEEVLKYWKRDQNEKKILNYIKEKFEFDGESGVEEEDHADKIPTPSQTPVIISTEKPGKKVKKNLKNSSSSGKNSANVEVILREKELNGSLRFVADGLSTEEECSDLLHLAQVAAVYGDGYDGKMTPLSKYEKFEGLTIGRSAILSKQGLVDLKIVQLFLDVSERGRHYVEKYFNLKSELFFTYTHLVCRTALETSSSERLDLSHPVHADNCLLQKDGSCLKEKPAFTYRDYSGVIYLNDDFEGGNFIFAANKTNIQAKVRPKCGRLVGFSAGSENLHGVEPVVSGRRCALAMWFTLDPEHEERERVLSQKVIDYLSSEQLNQFKDIGDSCVKRDYYLYFTDLNSNLNVDHEVIVKE